MAIRVIYTKEGIRKYQARLSRGVRGSQYHTFDRKVDAEMWLRNEKQKITDTLVGRLGGTNLTLKEFFINNLIMKSKEDSLLYIGNKGFGTFSVNGLSLLPLPDANINGITFTNKLYNINHYDNLSILLRLKHSKMCQVSLCYL